MKKTVFIILTLLNFLTCFSSPSITAEAESGNFYRVITEKAYLYENPSMQTVLFTLPYTYYVNVLGEKGNLYQIEIYGNSSTPSFFGYTEKENLFFDGLEVLSPYPTEKIVTCTSTILYADVDCSDKQNYIFPERKLEYFGTLQNYQGQTVYLVGYGDKIGYVKKSDVYPFTLPNHQNPLTFIQVEEEVKETISEDTTAVEQDDGLILKISIILCLVFAGAIGLYVALRKKEKPIKTVNYYDENEYE